MLKKYKILLFDIDDTLLDFVRAEKKAFEKLIKLHNIEYTEDILGEYKEYNKKLWKLLERGEITREELMETRFKNFFSKYNVKVVDDCDEVYRSFLAEGKQTFDGVHELLSELKQTHKLYVVSNGISKTQRTRLDNNNLFSYFEDVFISEEVGYQKPNSLFFYNIFQKIGEDIDLDTILIIGDSLSADIQGGFNVGIDTCWINKDSLPNTLSCIPTYILEKVIDLRKIK